VQPQTHRFGPFALDPGRELTRDGAPVVLGQRALAILCALLEASGKVVTKAELMERAWPGVTVEEGNITVQIASLRKELGARPDGDDWIVTVPRIGYRLSRIATAAAISVETAQPERGGKPSLALLPFVNLSGDPSRDYFADGIVEDLITALSRFKSFAVIARNSSFVYKNRAVDARQIAEELGVRYLLEGSVRLAGDHVRVTVQLIDAGTGAHQWAQSFNGELGQIFEFQDRITESVVGLVEPQIRKAEIDRARRSWPQSPAAYDHFLRALPHFYRGDSDGYFTALTHLEDALALEPDYAAAMAFASWTYARRGTMGLKALRAVDRARCIDLARRAILLGEDDPQVLAIAGHSLVAIGLLPVEGLATVNRARAANPNNVTVLNQAGICNMLCGDLDEAEACFRRAYQLSPGAPEAHESIAGVGFVRFFKEDFETAIDWMNQSLARVVDWPPNYWMLAASYAHLDRFDEARSVLAKLRALVPNTSVETMAILEPRFFGRYPLLRDGLVKAGLT
jgi:TolB-like protein/Tfp pilus assembly protein PilF